ncbi:MAG TPA: hypothetical protein PKE26_15965 [Kiritimatiellia bacterium]|nr:hypothetical protein [Kiritimatiellia bacterium]HMP00593.1 hypothetical protein [Kiritimatiellia bacterium]
MKIKNANMRLLEDAAKRRAPAVGRFEAKARIDSQVEIEYYRHGGILPYVLREYAAK